MANFGQHLERLRDKPEPVRHRIALGVATGLTSLVALGWVTALATSGTLAVKDTQNPVVSEEMSGTLAESGSAFSSLMGAAGAAFGATSTDPELTIIQTRASSTLTDTPRSMNDTDKTVIPF